MPVFHLSNPRDSDHLFGATNMLVKHCSLISSLSRYFRPIARAQARTVDNLFEFELMFELLVLVLFDERSKAHDTIRISSRIA